MVVGYRDAIFSSLFQLVITNQDKCFIVVRATAPLEDEFSIWVFKDTS